MCPPSLQPWTVMFSGRFNSVVCWFCADLPSDSSEIIWNKDLQPEQETEGFPCSGLEGSCGSAGLTEERPVW